MYSLYIPCSKVYVKVTRGMCLVRLIFKANLSESRRTNGKLNCDGEKQLARERQKAQRRHKNQKRYDLTRADFLPIITHGEQHVPLILARAKPENRKTES